MTSDDCSSCVVHMEEGQPLETASGHTFVHTNVSFAVFPTLEALAQALEGAPFGTWEECRTPCPEPVCRCGYFRLRWPTYEERQRERLAGPVA
jgi:hypothetical protein